ncbi:MAG: YbhN family protein [Solirubrobacterales bacterium]
MRRWLAELPHNETLVARLVRIVIWVGGLALLVFVLDLLGIPVSEWIRELFKKIREVPAWAVVSGVILQSAQTTLAAVAWLTILRAAYPRGRITFRLVLAAYATSVAMNSFLPANIGTWVMLIMFTTVIAGATFTAMLSGIAVQKIPFSIFNIAVYLYLFLSVAGSFSIKLGGLADHWVLAVAIAGGVLALAVLATRVFREQWHKLGKQLVVGGTVLRSPRRFFTGVLLPELGSYAARLAIIAVFLGAYSIPVTFHNVASVTASNSISNSVSLTPGGVGVTQAMNSAALRKEAGASTATAYSASQQLITSAWNVVFAVILVSWVFGWSGGKDLVRSSYEQAKVKSAELKEKRRTRRDAGHAAG